MDHEKNAYAEFSSNYLPDLFNYVVPLPHKGGDGAGGIGSGVLVNVADRHFIATARHCIENSPRAVRSTARLQPNMASGTRPLRIIGRGWHDTLDIGYLEIEDPLCAEIQWGQLCSGRITDGMVHIVGYPNVLTQVDWPRRGLSLCAGVFGTTLIEEEDDFLKFDYPEVGSKFNERRGEWEPSRFPETPRGFSGGGCFGVTSRKIGDVRVVEYKLLGIQCSWHPSERWVKVVRIKQWCELMKRAANID